MRILPAIDPRPLLERPRLFVGFSDVTAIHAALNVAGLATVHGPVVTQLGRLPEEPLEHLRALLFGAAPRPPREGAPPPGAGLAGTETVRAGKATGPLLGGTLTLLSHLAGTRWFPPLDGAILFVEDVGEKPYRLDRLLTQLRLAGLLDRVAGVAVGQLCGCDDGGVSGLDVVREAVRDLGVPAAAGFDGGARGSQLRAAAGAARHPGRAGAGRGRPAAPPLRRGGDGVTAPSPVLAGVAEALEAARAEGIAPALSAFVLRGGAWVHESCHGEIPAPEARPLGAGDLFDVASLTKVMATASVAVQLRRRGAARRGRAGRALAPRLRRGGARPDHGPPPPRALLRPAGLAAALRAGGGRRRRGAGLPAALGAPPLAELAASFARGEALLREAVLAEPLEAPPGSRPVYSDLGFLALGWILEAAGGDRLWRLAQRRVFEPLGLRWDGLRRRPGPAGGPRLPACPRLRPDRALRPPARGEPGRGQRRQRVGRRRGDGARRALLDRRRRRRARPGLARRAAGRAGRHPAGGAASSPGATAPWPGRRGRSAGTRRARRGRRSGRGWGAAGAARSATSAGPAARSGSTWTRRWSARSSPTTATPAAPIARGSTRSAPVSTTRWRPRWGSGRWSRPLTPALSPVGERGSAK